MGSGTFRRCRLGDAVSATGRFGDGGRKCFIRNKCVFEILPIMSLQETDEKRRYDRSGDIAEVVIGEPKARKQRDSAGTEEKASL